MKTRCVIGDVLVLIAKSHVVNGVDLIGKELYSDYMQSIDVGDIELRYERGTIKVPVEKCMFVDEDLRYW